MAGSIAAVQTSPTVVAVVLNWCNEQDTADCLRSLFDSDYPALSVLLVDNRSPDGSGARLHARFPHLPYLETEANLGYAGGNNRGIDWALERRADFVLVINNDATVACDCVSLLVRAAVETGAAVVAPEIRYAAEPAYIWYAGGAHSPARGLGVHWDIDRPVGRSAARTPVSFVTGCCLLVRSSMLRSVGAFDESYFAYVEDLEFCLRVASAGHRMLYEPAAHALHRIQRGAEPTPFQIRQRDRNRRRLAKTHYDVKQRLRFALWFYPTRAIHLARYAMKGQWKEVAAIADGAWGGLHQASGPAGAS